VGLAVLAWLLIAGEAEADPVKLVQPFQMRFTRWDTQVIAFLSGNPTYAAVEVFYLDRRGQPPLIRATLTRLDGFQIDQINDPAIVADLQTTGRIAVYREIDFQQALLPGDRVRVVAQFVSHLGEDIVLDVTTISPPSPAQAGLINPGNHSSTTSLPVLWPDASTLGNDESTVLIDCVPQPLVPGPVPGSVLAIYSDGFNLGVIRRDTRYLELIEGPEQLHVGASWTFADPIGGIRGYEVISLHGGRVIIRSTTGQEEIIVARRRTGNPDLLEMESVRVTGLPATSNIHPPPPAGLTLDLTPPGHFSLSLDEHGDLVTGTAAVSYDRQRVSWTLRPTQPSWAIPRVVNATGWFDRRGDVLYETTIGEPQPADPCPWVD